MSRRVQELTDLQLDLMRVLWTRGEATAAEVLELVKPRRQLAATTVATLLSRLEKKGVVAHRVDGRTYVYRPCASEDEVRRSLVGRVKQAFAGDMTALLAQLLDDGEIGAQDLARVRELIDARERELGGSNE
jgi:BlaI family transcriptional regulator, penicillinase repressor